MREKDIPITASSRRWLPSAVLRVASLRVFSSCPLRRPISKSLRTSLAKSESYGTDSLRSSGIGVGIGISPSLYASRKIYAESERVLFFQGLGFRLRAYSVSGLGSLRFRV